MPEESTPTIATEGNREAIAYLELGEHTDYFGRLFASAPRHLAALLTVNRLVEEARSKGEGPILEAIAKHVHEAIGLCSDSSPYHLHPITVQLRHGLITDVSGLPQGFVLRVEDYVGDDTSHPAWNEEKRCYVTHYDGSGIFEGEE